MPSNFVIPTTGGSPFFTNSCWPVDVYTLDQQPLKNVSCAGVHTRQFVSGQTEGVANDLLVEHTPDLEENLVDGYSGGPVIKRSLSFTHTHLFSTIVY